MRIRNILRNYIARFAFDFSLAPYDFDAATARRRTRFHDIHVFVVVSFSVHAEFAVVIWEEVSLGAVIVLRERPLHSHVVLPHEIFAANLERLRIVVDFLVLGCLF